MRFRRMFASASFMAWRFSSTAVTRTPALTSGSDIRPLPLYRSSTCWASPTPSITSWTSVRAAPTLVWKNAVGDTRNEVSMIPSCLTWL